MRDSQCLPIRPGNVAAALCERWEYPLAEGGDGHRPPRQQFHRGLSTVSRARKIAMNSEYGSGGGVNMLRWAVIFLVIALVAALFGFTGIASAAAGIAKFLFFLFLAVCLILFIAGLSVSKRL
jgi:uncharacterized membrane protein YtjA (UPF0391 family)